MAIRGLKGDMEPHLVYYEVIGRGGPAPANLFIVEPSWGSTRGVRFDHLGHEWKVDPLTVQYSLVEDIDQGTHRITKVARIRAEEVALMLGAALLSETELRKMLEDAG